MRVQFILSKRQDKIGHCQLNYYCLQDNGEKYGGIRLMRCTSDYEPSHPVIKFCDGIFGEFQKPKELEYDSDYTIKLKKLSRDYIKKYETEGTL